MGTALYTQASNAIRSNCPYHAGPAIAWLDDLPAGLKEWVVPPVRFDVARDYDMLADHTHGRDAANQLCFSEFRFVLTQLRSDDDELYYEAPVYAESLTSWRLVDERWLVCKTTFDGLDDAEFHTRFSLSDAMPR